MEESLVLAFLGILIVACLSFLGLLFIWLKEKSLKRLLLFLVSFSAGALIGDAFFHLIPESVGSVKGEDITVYAFIVVGIVSFFILEKIIHWRHCHVPTSKEHPHELGVMNLVGDALHNFLDGLIIVGSFLVSTDLGIATVIAVVMHEIPQKIGDFGILVYAGYSKMKAIMMNFFFSLISFLGGLSALFLTGKEDLLILLSSFTAGSFIYIAVADLIPEMKKDHEMKKSLVQLVSLVLGIGMMLAFKLYLAE